MIRKYLLKAAAFILTLLLFGVTAADMYIKTLGNTEGCKTYPDIAEITKKAVPPKNADGIARIMTYNLLAEGIGFEGSDPRTRSEGVCAVLNELSPDAVAFQEMSRKWYACIVNNTPYKPIRPLRTGLLGTMTGLAYNPLTLMPVVSGDEAFKSGNSSPLRRMVWAVFRHKSEGKLFAVISTHLSVTKTQSDTTALMQALELCDFSEKLTKAFKCPVIIAGDINSPEGTTKKTAPVFDVLSAFLSPARLKAENELSLSAETKDSVKDHIFHLGSISVKNYCILSNKKFLEISDHYPVFVDFYI